MFYQGNFLSIIQNNDKPKLYIYLKKFYYECIITKKIKDITQELIFPIFPFVNIANQIENLKFHDLVIQLKIQIKDLYDLIIKYDHKFKIVNGLNANNEDSEEEEEKEEQEKEEEEKEEEEEKNEEEFTLNTDNHDIIWLLFSLVSENFISYYTLIKLVNRKKKELENIIKNDKFLFIIILHEILKTKYALDNKRIRFYNENCFLAFIYDFQLKELNKDQKKDYEMIKSIYTDNNIIRGKYFYYIWEITPLTCYFKIPFLKKGIYLIDKYQDIKSYHLINVNFKKYKRINKIEKNDKILKIKNNSYNYYIYNIIKNSHSFGDINYEYMGATADNIKFRNCWFINSDLISKIQKMQEFQIITAKDYFYFNEILFNIDYAAYLCSYKSIKKIKIKEVETNESAKSSNNMSNSSSILKSSNSFIFTSSGILSKTLKNLIIEKCGIHSFNSCFGIINGFIGNFTTYDSDIINFKKRIVVRENINNPKDKKIERDNKFFILNIYKYKNGLVDNESINFLDLMGKQNKDNFTTNLVNNSLSLNINNIYNKVQIDKLKFFLKHLNIKDCNNSYFGNKFFIEIKQAFNIYQHILLTKNIVEIPDSAILGGIIDEYNIMNKIQEKHNYILLIINNDKYKNKIIEGNGIIFKTRTKYINSNFALCKIKFFDIDKYEKNNKHNIKIIEKIRKVKELKNVIIFPRNSVKLFEELLIEDISQQEFFISWNKELVDNIRVDSFKEKEEKKEKDENSVTYGDLKRLYIENKYSKNNRFYSLPKANFIFKNNKKYLRNNTRNDFIIDYKNLTKILYKEHKYDLNELELFYLEYIPKCTSIIIKTINKFKELMHIYSTNNLVDLLIGNINIDMNSIYYSLEIDNINDKIDNYFNEVLGYLINPFKCLQNQNQNKEEYLSKYNDRMFIISTIVYNICYYPNKIKKIITNYRKIIKKFIFHKMKFDEEKIKEINFYIQINDNFASEIDNLGVDYYRLFECDNLIDNNNTNKNFVYSDYSSSKNGNIEKYENFFEDFKLIVENNNEIKRYYIPELLFYKYLCKLVI